MKQFSEIKRLQDAETGLTLKKKKKHQWHWKQLHTVPAEVPYTHTHMCLGIWRVEGRENPIIHKNEKLIELQTLGREATHKGQTYIFCHVISHQSNEGAVVQRQMTESTLLIFFVLLIRHHFMNRLTF